MLTCLNSIGEMTMETNELHAKVLLALAASTQADNGKDTALESGKTLRANMFDVAKACKTEKVFDENMGWLYQHLTTAEGKAWAEANGVVLTPSKRKDFPFALPQSFKNVVSVLRGALKRDLLKGSYQATRTAKQDATRDETDTKRRKALQDETMPLEKRHLAAEGLAGRRRDVAIKHINAAFDGGDYKTKEHIATLLEALAKEVTKVTSPQVTMPQGEQTPHAASRKGRKTA